MLPQSHMVACLLSSVIMAKLPPDIRLIVSREVKKEWQLDPLLKLVEREVKCCRYRYFVNAVVFISVCLKLYYNEALLLHNVCIHYL